MTIQFPFRGRGGQTALSDADYDYKVATLRRWMQQYKQRLGFAPSSRGWCYALESAGAITKAQFDKAIRKIAELRKSGDLDFSLVAADDARALNGYDFYSREDTPEDYLINRLKRAIKESEDYRPVSYWKHQQFYPVVMVEKIDLVQLFRQALPRAVKIFNAGGWSDVNSRLELIREFEWAEQQDLIPVLLYCGDHDPAGLMISQTLKSQLEEIAETWGWDGLDDLEIVRFGLNADQIEEAGFSWIDNLITSSKKDLAKPSHPDHNKAYVQDYLSQYGARKVEANALVAAPELGRQIMADAVWEWLDEEAVRQWEAENSLSVRRAKEQAANLTAWLGMLHSSGLLFTPSALLHGGEIQRAIKGALPAGD
jgi:hypothetical protein